MMNLTLDHIIIAVHVLDQAVEHFRELGFTVIYGGEHAAGTTHNALICFADGTYFELLAPTGKTAAPDNTAMDFSHLVHGAEGFVGFALYTDNIEAAVDLLQKQMVILSPVSSGSRTRKDGVTLEWRTVTIDGDLYPFVIQDVTPRELRVSSDPDLTTHANSASGIKQLDVPSHHERIAQALAPFQRSPDTFQLGQTLLKINQPARVYLSGLTASLPDQNTHGVSISCIADIP